MEKEKSGPTAVVSEAQLEAVPFGKKVTQEEVKWNTREDSLPCGPNTMQI